MSVGVHELQREAKSLAEKIGAADLVGDPESLSVVMEQAQMLTTHLVVLAEELEAHSQPA
jgi:hypothetical protein